MKKRTAVLISGRGSNMAALIEAAKGPGYPAEIALVLSNKKAAAGLAIAASAGLPTAIVEHRAFPDRASFDAAIDRELTAARIDLVCLAGFMRLLTPGFVERWRDRMINIHPSLLPAFPGTDTHARALAAGVKLHGCTVHYVRAEMDNGPIIAQAAVPVLEGDSEEALSQRLLRAEHKLYPFALGLVASGRAKVVNERVVIGSNFGEDGQAILASPPTPSRW